MGRVHGNIHPAQHLLDYRLDNSAAVGAVGDDGGVAIVQGILGSLEVGQKEGRIRHCERTMTIRSQNLRSVISTNVRDRIDRSYPGGGGPGGGAYPP